MSKKIKTLQIPKVENDECLPLEYPTLNTTSFELQELYPQKYILRFGIYKNQRACDVINITKSKTSKEGIDYIDKCGRKYLQFLIERCDWLHTADKNCINKILNN